MSTVKEFALSWLQLGEQLGHRAIEADYDDEDNNYLENTEANDEKD